jgi:16S rRNA (uracil1498-N3)-methyltransferase
VPQGAAAHVLVEDLSGPVLALSEDDSRHLSSVLRLRPGEAVAATDGRGGLVPCVWSAGGRLEVAGPVVVSAPRSPRLTVGFVPVKGDRPDWAVQKLTELGVDRIVLLSSERSVVRWEGGRAAAHLARLERVARSALMQSRQVWLPEIVGVVPVPELLAGAGPGVAVADIGGAPLGAGVDTVLVGPEGGWSDAERALSAATVGLGSGVLRAETAAVAAGVLLTAVRAGLVGLVGLRGADGPGDS